MPASDVIVPIVQKEGRGFGELSYLDCTLSTHRCLWFVILSLFSCYPTTGIPIQVYTLYFCNEYLMGWNVESRKGTIRECGRGQNGVSVATMKKKNNDDESEESW